MWGETYAMYRSVQRFTYLPFDTSLRSSEKQGKLRLEMLLALRVLVFGTQERGNIKRRERHANHESDGVESTRRNGNEVPAGARMSSSHGARVPCELIRGWIAEITRRSFRHNPLCPTQTISPSPRRRSRTTESDSFLLLWWARCENRSE